MAGWRNLFRTGCRKVRALVGCWVIVFPRGEFSDQGFEGYGRKCPVLSTDPTG